MKSFEQLLEDGASVPLVGWDFSWFVGRATEERPSWGYAAGAAARARQVERVLDLETGGGEVFSFVLTRANPPPPLAVATEGWRPNRPVARDALARLGAAVVATDGDALPFEEGTFELVLSRHPVQTPWSEVTRVLRVGGTFLSQQVGAGSNRELTDFMMGPQPVATERSPAEAARRAGEAGLEVVELRRERLRTVFYDVGAVVHFLRKVPWTVPGFSVEGYRDRLEQLHELVERDGHFLSHSERFLIEAQRM